MLVLLPPSETKRPGGEGPPLDLGALAHPGLRAPRESVVSALVDLAADAEATTRVLKLGPSLHGEVETNRMLRESPTMPAVDRYTGVLYDALDAGSLTASARAWLGEHVQIHSAPFGPVGALDPIPAYRLPAGASVPGLPSLRQVWADAVADALRGASFVLDLRSEAYVALGPVPAEVPSAYVRVVAEGPDGAARALNHFNKHAKGELVRLLATRRPRIDSVAALRRWAHRAGIRLDPGSGTGEVELYQPAARMLSPGTRDR